MRRLFISGVSVLFAGGAVFFGAVLLAAGARAQGVPSKKEMSELIYEAHSHRYLTTKDAAPFHLVAKFRYAYGGVTKTGTYELLWAGPERYREEFRLGDDIGETDLALDDKLYVHRNTNFIPYPLWRIRRLLALPDSSLRFQYGAQHPVQSIQQVAANVLLVKVEDEHTKHYVRTDLTGNEIVSEESSVEEKKLKESLAFDTFENFGPVHYPRHILFSLNDETMEVNVTKVERVETFGDNVFMPPADATEQDWCAAPTLKLSPLNHLDAPYIVMAPSLDQHKMEGTYYYEFSADGHLEKVAKLLPDGTATELKVNPKERDSRPFPVRTCAGKPVPHYLISSAYAPF